MPAPSTPERRLLRSGSAPRWHLPVTTILGVLAAALVVAQAAVLAHILAGAERQRAGLSVLGGALLVLAALLLARALLGAAMELSGRLGALGAMATLRRRLVRHLLLRAPVQARELPAGEVVTAAVSGVDALEPLFAGLVPARVLAATVPVAVLAWVLHTDPVCALILALTVPILVVFMILIGTGAAGLTQRRWRTLAALSGRFLDVVTGLETLRAHGREWAQAEAMATVGERLRRETMATLRLAFLSAFVLELCAMVGTALVAATIGVQLIAGSLRLEAGLCVLLLAPELYAPLRAVGQQFHASADGLAAAETILGVVDAPAPGADPGEEHLEGHAPAPDPRRGAIRVQDVSFTYPGRRVPALENVSLALAPGAMTVLSGPSGAGKSTLAALLLGLLAPDSGQILCDGVDLATASPGAWRQRCAWVPQRATLFRASLAENIALAAPGAPRAAILAAATQAGLAPLLERLPGGLDTPVGEGGRPLSAGETRRMALARAFLGDPSLVILDEPTANLDRASADALLATISRLARGRTVLVITHDPAFSGTAADQLHLDPVGAVPGHSPVPVAA